jgi:Right handed beta helix region
MKRNYRLLITVFAVNGFIVTAQADVFVNNKTGNNANTGRTPDLPVKTIAAGMKKLYSIHDSKLVITNNGTPYYESLRISRGGTADKPLIIDGGGATISGLKEMPTAKWVKKGKLYFYPFPRVGARRPYLVINGKEVPRGANKIETLKPYSHYWAKPGVYFKPENGKKIADYKVFGTLLSSGVKITNSHYITCRNITSEYFSNDGFNVHGYCQNLIFENIVGRYNGDDGFSVHEDVGSTVRNGYFHNNNYGIQDVNAARSEYYGVLIENNRKIGVNFCGGFHTLLNATVRNNALGQVKVNGNKSNHIGLDVDNPLVTGLAFIKDTYISGSVYGLHVGKPAKVVVMNSVITNTPTGIICDSTAGLYLKGIIIKDCSRAMIENRNPNLKIDFSILAPGNYMFGKKSFPANKFAEWSKTCKSGKNILNKKVDLIMKPHIFKNGRHALPVGLRMTQFQYNQKK